LDVKKIEELKVGYPFIDKVGVNQLVDGPDEDKEKD
jgi:hypothetical protein